MASADTSTEWAAVITALATTIGAVGAIIGLFLNHLSKQAAEASAERAACATERAESRRFNEQAMADFRAALSAIRDDQKAQAEVQARYQREATQALVNVMASLEILTGRSPRPGQPSNPPRYRKPQEPS